MKTIALCTQKGGSGKTTLAVNLAVAAMIRRQRTVLFDMDAQATAGEWAEKRNQGAPEVIALDGRELSKALETAEKQKIDFVFIDTAGRDAPNVASAIRAADFCLIPCRPSPPDLHAVTATVETAKRLNKPFAFVLMQTPVRSFRNDEAKEALKIFGMVAPVTIGYRNVFQDAQGIGLGVQEYAAKSKAADEIRDLWKWIIKQL